MKFASIILFSLIFIFSLSPTNALAGDDKKSTERSKSLLADEKFCENLRFLPIIFKERSKNANGYKLEGKFEPPAGNAGVSETLTFSVSRDFPVHHFLKRDDDFSEEIDFDKFISKCKDELWFVEYLPLQNNEIYSASQFKNWEVLKQTYPQDPDDVNQTVFSREFWDELRIKTVYVPMMNNKEIIWTVLGISDEPFTPAQADEGVYLYTDEKGEKKYIHKYEHSESGVTLMIKNHGSLLLHDNCVFGVIDSKSTMSLVTKATIGLIGNERVRIRLLGVSRQYFVANMAKVLWYCFYNIRSGVALRISQASLLFAGDSLPDVTNHTKDKKDKK